MDKQQKILIIDDDPDFVESISHILKAKSYDVVVAENGEEGTKKIRSEKPDLVLLDILMPKKDGYLVADEISKDPQVSNIPILALTSVIETLGPPPFPFNVSGYLQKSISPADLLSNIKKYLDPTEGSNKQQTSRYVFP
jgi:CheY-like chemotaxis protein